MARPVLRPTLRLVLPHRWKLRYKSNAGSGVPIAVMRVTLHELNERQRRGRVNVWSTAHSSTL